MTATRQEVDQWIETARENGNTHIVVMCDTFDYDNYPIYVNSQEEADKAVKDKSGKNMQQLQEIIDVTKVD